MLRAATCRARYSATVIKPGIRITSPTLSVTPKAWNWSTTRPAKTRSRPSCSVTASAELSLQLFPYPSARHLRLPSHGPPGTISSQCYPTRLTGSQQACNRYVILTFLSGPAVLKYWKLIGSECIWYPGSFELDYPSTAVDFASRDEAIRQSGWKVGFYTGDDKSGLEPNPVITRHNSRLISGR